LENLLDELLSNVTRMPDLADVYPQMVCKDYLRRELAAGPDHTHRNTALCGPAKGHSGHLRATQYARLSTDELLS
jgi:hypothetical protein